MFNFSLEVSLEKNPDRTINMAKIYIPISGNFARKLTAASNIDDMIALVLVSLLLMVHHHLFYIRSLFLCRHCVKLCLVFCTHLLH